MMTRLSPFALAGALIATSVSVMAANPVQAATRHVSYADLDLTSATGRSMMDARIRKAVLTVVSRGRIQVSINVERTQGAVAA